MADTELREAYKKAKQEFAADAKSEKAGEAILDLALTSLKFLKKECQQVDLDSRVGGKNYFSFKKAKVVARPANKGLFLAEAKTVKRLWKEWLEKKNQAG